MTEYRYRINELKLKVGESHDVIPALVCDKLGLKRSELGERVLFSRELSPGKWLIRRESTDARDKGDIRLVYTVDISLGRELKKLKDLSRRSRLKIAELRAEAADGTAGNGGASEVERGAAPAELAGEGRQSAKRPVIVGFGPCGIFAARELALHGYRPIVLERGSEMTKRIEDVERFRGKTFDGRKTGTERILDPESNVLFGEGGAGTFSDGKLTSGIRDDNVRRVLEVFYEAGADERILYAHKPHIGTDVLREVIVNIRKDIERMGGEVRFDTRLDSFLVSDGHVTGVRVHGRCPGGEDALKNDAPENDAFGYEIETDAVILALGHSARDTFEMLKESGIVMEQKPFSIGVRMEHPQELIDRAQYGKEDRLPPADYKISYKAANGRGVYSFCMCPGGEVIVCSTCEGEVCVNGMSNHGRDSGTANSGILCDVRREDFGSDDVLAGIRFQEKYEKLAFVNGGGDFSAPSCSMKDFLSGKGDSAAVTESLPDFAVEAIREAVPHFARKIKGYDADDAVVTAVETRSSSPVRIVRNDVGIASLAGLYPAGEGAGYAGGITSAACDGIRAANRVMAAPE